MQQSVRLMHLSSSPIRRGDSTSIQRYRFRWNKCCRPGRICIGMSSEIHWSDDPIHQNKCRGTLRIANSNQALSFWRNSRPIYCNVSISTDRFTWCNAWCLHRPFQFIVAAWHWAELQRIGLIFFENEFWFWNRKKIPDESKIEKELSCVV